jgi:hypothetical protein
MERYIAVRRGLRDLAARRGRDEKREVEVDTRDQCAGIKAKRVSATVTEKRWIKR